MNEMMAELDQMSGSSQQKAQPLRLDEVALNGKDGVFITKHKTKEKVKEGDREVYEKSEHKGTLALLFLKKRRVLIERGKGGTKVRETSEHNTVYDTVQLYDRATGKTEIGVAKELRDRYPNLRTHEVVYAKNLASGEVLRLIIRGSSLHMEKEVKGMTLFYDYIQSFKGDDKFYLYETELEPTPVKTDLGTVYAINFKRGRKITDDELKEVAKDMRKVHENTTALDAQIVTRPVEQRQAEIRQEQVINYDEGEIDTDSIPF